MEFDCVVTDGTSYTVQLLIPTDAVPGTVNGADGEGGVALYAYGELLIVNAPEATTNTLTVDSGSADGTMSGTFEAAWEGDLTLDAEVSGSFQVSCA